MQTARRQLRNNAQPCFGLNKHSANRQPVAPIANDIRPHVAINVFHQIKALRPQLSVPHHEIIVLAQHGNRWHLRCNGAIRPNHIEACTLVNINEPLKQSAHRICVHGLYHACAITRPRQLIHEAALKSVKLLSGQVIDLRCLKH